MRRFEHDVQKSQRNVLQASCEPARWTAADFSERQQPLPEGRQIRTGRIDQGKPASLTRPLATALSSGSPVSDAPICSSRPRTTSIDCIRLRVYFRSCPDQRNGRCLLLRLRSRRDRHDGSGTGRRRALCLAWALARYHRDSRSDATVRRALRTSGGARRRPDRLPSGHFRGKYQGRGRSCH